MNALDIREGFVYPPSTQVYDLVTVQFLNPVNLGKEGMAYSTRFYNATVRQDLDTVVIKSGVKTYTYNMANVAWVTSEMEEAEEVDNG